MKRTNLPATNPPPPFVTVYLLVLTATANPLYPLFLSELLCHGKYFGLQAIKYARSPFVALTIACCLLGSWARWVGSSVHVSTRLVYIKILKTYFSSVVSSSEFRSL